MKALFAILGLLCVAVSFHACIAGTPLDVVPGLRILSGPAEKLMGNWLMLVGLVGIIVLYAIVNPTYDYYCSKCDQYLGRSRQMCPRCGSNRYMRQKVG
jgi:hypothetical protein